MTVLEQLFFSIIDWLFFIENYIYYLHFSLEKMKLGIRKKPKFSHILIM